MKHLMTLVALFVSSLAMAQIPTLPWNPDENGDQFVGPADLLALLAAYGEEFNSAIVNEDGTSAIIDMGLMGRLECEYACDNLPGYWTLPNPPDLTPFLGSYFNAWLAYDWSKPSNVDSENRLQIPHFANEQPAKVYMSFGLDSNIGCYCTTKQLPRVDMSQCEVSSTSYDTSSGVESCMSNKVLEGWLPLGGPKNVTQSNGLIKTVQAFWRFAQ